MPITPVVRIAAIILLVAAIASCREPARSRSIDVFIEVYHNAVEQDFDYDAELEAALEGNILSLTRLFRFSAHTDAASALGHGIVLAKVLEAVGDDRFATAVLCCDHECRARVFSVIQAGTDDVLMHDRCIDVHDYPLTLEALVEPEWTG